MTTFHLEQPFSPQARIRFVSSLRLVESEFGGQALALVLLKNSLSDAKEHLNH